MKLSGEQSDEMERTRSEEEASKDPGAQQPHQTYSEKDFEGRYLISLAFKK